MLKQGFNDYSVTTSLCDFIFLFDSLSAFVERNNTDKVLGVFPVDHPVHVVQYFVGR